MRDLQRYANECISDMKILGIDIPKITFEVNTRAKKRFGQCRYVGNGQYSININIDLLSEECGVKALKETLYHEIIHTLPKCMNHGEKFKYYADIVNKAYNVNITRCSSYESKYGKEYAEKIIERNKENERQRIKYEVFCPKCGKVRGCGYFKRQPKWYAHVERYHCNICKGKLERLDVGFTLLTAEGVRN
jgi:ribosomal protein L33